MPTFIYTALLLILCLSLQAQEVQQKVFIEEVTGSWCGPCAVHNPNFDAIIEANDSKVVTLKYQYIDHIHGLNPLPGSIRNDYYSLSAVPQYVINGEYKGNPGNFSQTLLNQTYNGTMTPFSIEMSHAVNVTLDSILISVTIKNESLDTVRSQAPFSLKLRVALTEEELHYKEAPGSNGETEFKWVMRDMYPSANGTILDNTWLPGQEETFDFHRPLPDVVLDYHQISAVAFIQDDEDKYVYQAEKTEPDSILTGVADTELELISDPNKNWCDTLYDPVFMVVNHGPESLSQFLIQLSLDGEIVYNWPYTQELGVNDTAIIQTPPISLPNQFNRLDAEITSLPNGIKEGRQTDPFQMTMFNSINQRDEPIKVGFEVFENPPNWPIGLNWLFDRDMDGWLYDSAAVAILNPGSKGGAFGESNTSVNFRSYVPGWKGGFILDQVDMSSSVGGALEFSMAYAQKDSAMDRLIVSSSIDCGETWEEEFNRAGADLANTTVVSGNNLYPNADQWTKHRIELNKFIGEKVVFKFEYIGDRGHWFYLDDIHLARYAVGIEDNELEEAVTIAPNPFSSSTQVNISLDHREKLDIRVVDAVGRVMSSQVHTHLGGSSQIQVGESSWADGLYHVVMSSETAQISKKILLRK
ncbi:MAG: T9SS type A sorting domain-containing protein [Bacteroidota bacterium]